jgi:hypothetical protein
VKLRSKVWTHFTRNPYNPKECACNFCKRKFTCGSKGGTTHLNRHVDDRLYPIYKRELSNTNAKSQTSFSFAIANSNVVWKFY